MARFFLKGPCQPSMEDLEIILAYREKRHATCFRLLHDRYAAKIYSKALTMLRDQDEAQDATQEIFTKIFLNLGKFQGQSKFSTWVYSVTYNFCIDKIRKEKRSRELFADELENPPDLEADVDDDPELAAMQVNELRTVLSKLGDADRSLLLLKYKDGMKIKDIADLFGKNESAVKMQIMRAKEKAKRIHQDLFAASIK
ncbi:sigma-70 family RNA polymerase sigma factor [Neolewinella lacunae]|nr:sigma-70 family RNA polymerase sigma factor [Neolewinella lacunae]MDN3634017.1 sigma-70 family RNA polymerase sigma factor [Neolewinella lacunae]